MTEQEIVMMAAEVAAKAAVAAVRAILGKEIQESVEAAVTDAARLGAEASIKAVEQERKKFRDGRSDRRFRNTKLLLRFLSTPSARRATGGAAAACKKRRISIHALREEGDRRKLSVRWPCTAISIHALREEGDAGGNRR